MCINKEAVVSEAGEKKGVVEGSREDGGQKVTNL